MRIESYPYWNLNLVRIVFRRDISSIESYPYWNLNPVSEDSITQMVGDWILSILEFKYSKLKYGERVTNYWILSILEFKLLNLDSLSTISLNWILSILEFKYTNLLGYFQLGADWILSILEFKLQHRRRIRLLWQSLNPIHIGI